MSQSVPGAAVSQAIPGPAVLLEVPGLIRLWHKCVCARHATSRHQWTLSLCAMEAAYRGLELACISHSPSLPMLYDHIRTHHFQSRPRRCDHTFSTPKAVAFLDFQAPEAYATPRAAVCGRLLMKLLCDELTEVTYPAELAGLSYNLSNSQSGFVVSREGVRETGHYVSQSVTIRRRTQSIAVHGVMIV